MNLTKESTQLLCSPVTTWLSDHYYSSFNYDTCFAGDVVVNIGEISDEQRAFIGNTASEIKILMTSFAQKLDEMKDSKLYYYDMRTILFDYLFSLVSASKLTKFQIQQININSYMLFTDLQKPAYHNFNSLLQDELIPFVVHNFEQHALQHLSSHINGSSCNDFSLRDYMNMDRVGILFKAILQRMIQTTTSLPGKYLSLGDPSCQHLARYRDNDELEVAVLETSRSYVLFKRHIHGKESSQNIRRYRYNTAKEVDDKFRELYKQLTNRDYAENDVFPPSEDNQFFGHFKAIKMRYRIPPLKQMCFAVLSELYIIDKLKFNDKINQLTLDTLRQYLIYCFQDDKPVGGEVAVYLRSYLANNYSEDAIDDMYPFQPFIESVFNRHDWIYKSYTFKVPQNLFKAPYDYNLLINVYENKHLFKPKQLPKSNILLQQAVYDSNKPLILQDKHVFVDNFHNNTTGFFKDDFNFDNVVVIGGIMTTSLTGESTGFEQSDIDICFYGLTEQQIAARINHVIDIIGKKHDISICQSDTDIIISRHYPHRHIQFSCTLFKTIQEVLLGVDIESSCFAFDGNNVWTTQRGIEAFNYRTNFATQTGYLIRGEDIYQRRLLKYLERGFSIAYLPNSIIEENVKLMNNERLYSTGIELLFKAKNNPRMMKLLLNKNRKGGLPFGPDVKKDNFNTTVSANFDANYDGYNSSDWPDIVDKLDEIYGTLSFPTDNYAINHFYHFQLTKDTDHNRSYYDQEDDEDPDV